MNQEDSYQKGRMRRNAEQAMSASDLLQTQTTETLIALGSQKRGP